MKFNLCFVAGSILLFSFIGNCAAWGTEGHLTIGSCQLNNYQYLGKIAEAYLSPTAAFYTSNLLSYYGGSIANASMWADKVKYVKTLTWSRPLHYVDVNDCDSNYQGLRDCPDGVCIVGAIANFTSKLTCSNSPVFGERDYLKWIIHLIGKKNFINFKLSEK